MHIPIISDGGQILGWTDKVPEFKGVALLHVEAEQLLGGPISCIYVQIANGPDAQQAGAPPDWSGPWRCLAICSERTGMGAQNGGLGAWRPSQPQ